MSNIGFIRVSTKDQNYDLQKDALEKAGCEKIFEVKESGAKQESEKLKETIAYMRKGDTLVIWKLSRLHRSVKKGLRILYELKDKGIQIKSIKDGIDTSTKAGEFIYIVVSWIAEWDLENIRENTIAGLDAARSRGIVGGKPFALNDKEQVEKMISMYQQKDVSIKDILKIFGITQRSMNGYIHRHKTETLWYQKNYEAHKKARRDERNAENARARTGV